jgi:hypothetical protein
MEEIMLTFPERARSADSRPNNVQQCAHCGAVIHLGDKVVAYAPVELAIKDFATPEHERAIWDQLPHRGSLKHPIVVCDKTECCQLGRSFVGVWTEHGYQGPVFRGQPQFTFAIDLD